MYRISETGVNNIRVALQSETSNQLGILNLITGLLDADHDLWKATWNNDPKIGCYENFAAFANQKHVYSLYRLTRQLFNAVHELMMVHHRLFLSEMILYTWRVHHGSCGDSHRTIPVLAVSDFPTDVAQLSKYESYCIMCRVVFGEDNPSSDAYYLGNPRFSPDQLSLPLLHKLVGVLRWQASVLRRVYFDERLKSDEIRTYVHKAYILPATKVVKYQVTLSQEVPNND